MKNCLSDSVPLLSVYRATKSEKLTRDKLEFLIDYLSQEKKNLKEEEAKSLIQLGLDGISISLSDNLRLVDELLLLLTSHSDSISKLSSFDLLAESVVKNLLNF